MQAIIAIAVNDLRIFLKDIGNLIFLLIVPIGMTLVLGLGLGGAFGGSGDARLRVDMIDNDNSELSAQFIASLKSANTSLVLCPQDNDDENFCQLDAETTFSPDTARERIQDTTSLAFIEIPAGFGEAVTNREPVTISYVSNEDLTAPGLIQEAVNAALLRLNGAIVAARVGEQVISSAAALDADDPAAFGQGVYDRAVGIWAANPVRVDYQLSAQEEDSGANLQAGFGQTIPGLGSMFVMFTVFGGMTVMVTERKQWTLQRLVMTPVSRAQLLGGKILGRFVLGMLQFGVMFIFGLLVGINFGRDPLAIVLVMVMYTLAITAVSFALGNRLKTDQQASSLSLLLSLMLAALGGAWWPLEIVPEAMQIVGHISPVAWAMDGFNMLIFNSGGLGDILVPLAVLGVMAIAFFALAIWRFEYE